jgi:CBS-domain-containing membrane protein
MTTSQTTISNTDTIRQVTDLLAKGSFNSLPVIEKEGDVVGIVTTTDLINYLNHQYREPVACRAVSRQQNAKINS